MKPDDDVAPPSAGSIHRMLRRLLPLLLLALLASGCGAIRSTVGIVEAEKALKAAHEAGARDRAPYPITLAEEMLTKAKEEMGYAEYSRSFEFAREARELAENAETLARKTPDAPPTRMVPLQATGTAEPNDEDQAAPGTEAAGDDDDSAGDDDDSAGNDDDSAGDDDDSAGDDDDSAGDGDDSAGDDDDSATEPTPTTAPSPAGGAQ